MLWYQDTTEPGPGWCGWSRTPLTTPLPALELELFIMRNYFDHYAEKIFSILMPPADLHPCTKLGITLDQHRMMLLVK